MTKIREESSSSEQFFRNEQLSWAVQEAASEPPPLLAQFGVVFLFLFFVAAFVYVSVIEVPVTVEGGGLITSEFPPLPIRASASFTVDKVLVADNQVVKAGAELVTSLENLSPQDLEKLRKFLAGTEKISKRGGDNLCLDCDADLASISQIYLTIRGDGGFLGVVSPINDLVRQLRAEISSYKQIGRTVAGVKLQVDNAQRKLSQIEARRATKVLAKEVEELRAIIVSGNAQIEQRYREAARQIREMRATLRARTKELEDRLREIGRAYSITAPIAGRVTNYKLKGPGELISAGQLLFEIVPANSQMVATMDILNRDISKVKKGDKVIIAIDSLPEIDYGTIEGTLIEISRAEPTEDRGGAPAPSQGDRAYRAKVQLKVQSLGKGADLKPLILGMSLRGRIVTGNETLLRRLYAALFNVKEGLKGARR